MLNASHDFLCTVHRVFMHRGVLHLVMDLVNPPAGPGSSPDLFQWLTDHDATEEDIATIVHRIALAMRYLNQPPLCCIQCVVFMWCHVCETFICSAVGTLSLVTSSLVWMAWTI